MKDVLLAPIPATRTIADVAAQLVGAVCLVGATDGAHGRRAADFYGDLVPH